MSCRATEVAIYAAFLALAILASRHEYSHHVQSNAASIASVRSEALLSKAQNASAAATALRDASEHDSLVASEWNSRAKEALDEQDADMVMAQNETVMAQVLRARAGSEWNETKKHEAMAEYDEVMYERDALNATKEAEDERSIEDEMKDRGCDGRFIFFDKKRACDELRNRAEAEKSAVLSELREAAKERDDEKREKDVAADYSSRADADADEADRDEADAVEARERAEAEEEEAERDEAAANESSERSQAEAGVASKRRSEASDDERQAMDLADSAEAHRGRAARDRRKALALASCVLVAFLIRLVVLVVDPVRSAMECVSTVSAHLRKSVPSMSSTRRTVLVLRTVLYLSRRRIGFLALHVLALFFAIASFSAQWAALEAGGPGSPASFLSRGSLVVLSPACVVIAVKTAAFASLAHVIGLDPLPRLCDSYRGRDDDTYESRTYGSRLKAELKTAVQVVLVDAAFLIVMLAIEALVLFVCFGSDLFGSKLVSARDSSWIYGVIFVVFAAVRLRRNSEEKAPRAAGGGNVDAGVSVWPGQSDLFLGMVDELLDGADYDRNVATGEILRVFEEIESSSNDQRASVETDSLLGRVIERNDSGAQRRTAEQQSNDVVGDDSGGENDGLLDVVSLSAGKVSVISSIGGNTIGRKRGGIDRGRIIWRALAMKRAFLLELPFTILVVTCMVSVIAQCLRLK